MPIQPLTVTLTDGQKIDVLKRFRKIYADELEKIEAQMTEILTTLAEADHLAQFLGEQPEVKDMRNRQSELAALDARRNYLAKIIDRLASVTPAQAEVKAPLPSGASSGRGGSGGSGGSGGNSSSSGRDSGNLRRF